MTRLCDELCALCESWQLDQIVIRNTLHRMPRLAPGAQSTGDDKNFESEFL